MLGKHLVGAINYSLINESAHGSINRFECMQYPNIFWLYKSFFSSNIHNVNMWFHRLFNVFSKFLL